MNYFVFATLLILVLFLLLIALLVAAGIQLKQNKIKGNLALVIMADIIIIVLLCVYMIYYTRPHEIKENYECYYNTLSPK